MQFSRRVSETLEGEWIHRSMHAEASLSETGSSKKTVASYGLGACMLQRSIPTRGRESSSEHLSNLSAHVHLCDLG